MHHRMHGKAIIVLLVTASGAADWKVAGMQEELQQLQKAKDATRSCFRAHISEA